MFSCEFCKIYKNLLFTENFQTTASVFFYSFYCFATWLTNRNRSFYFGHVLSCHSNVMNIMNLNDLVAAARKHTFLGDITWNLAVFCRLISASIRTYGISVLTNGTPKRQIKSKMKLEKAVILRCSVKRVFSNIY